LSPSSTLLDPSFGFIARKAKYISPIIACQVNNQLSLNIVHSKLLGYGSEFTIVGTYQHKQCSGDNGLEKKKADRHRQECNAYPSNWPRN
jgi:hypothetical protein